jgi:MoaA/NifB/PqqE/SkfB family radical SAM enzyme
MYREVKEMNLALNMLEVQQGSLSLDSLPISLYVDINLKCNLSCPMCHRNHPQYRGYDWPTMEIDTFMKVARELFPTAYRVMLTGGGESLVHKRIDKILQLCLDYEVFPTIVTNGTTMTRKRAILLAQAGAYMGISVDGATRETFEALRYPARWDRLLKSLAIITRVREAVGNESFFPHFQVVVQKHNLSELPGFIDMATANGFELVKYSKIYPHFPELEERVPDPEEVSRAFVEVLEKANEQRVRVEVPDYGETSVSGELMRLREKNVFPISLDLSQSAKFVSGGFVKYPDYHSKRCQIPFSECMITPEGKVVVGCCSQYQLGDLAEDSFSNIWNGPGYRELRGTVNSANPMDFCTREKCPFRN